MKPDADDPNWVEKPTTAEFVTRYLLVDEDGYLWQQIDDKSNWDFPTVRITCLGSAPEGLDLDSGDVDYRSELARDLMNLGVQ